MASLKDRVIPFQFQPFSRKQQIVLSWWTDASAYKDMNAIICD